MPYHSGPAVYTEFTMTKVPVRLEPVRYVAGLDVAQQHDWTALAILELVYAPGQHKVPSEIRLVALDRWQMLYPDTLEELGYIFSDEPWAKRTLLATDATGPGLHLYEDMVPKNLLITRLQSALRRHLIKVPEKLPLYNILESEIEGYELKVREGSKHVTFSNNPRDGGPEHDDTILALSLAWWRAHYKPKGSTKLRVIR
jgi:hypothetical protein